MLQPSQVQCFVVDFTFGWMHILHGIFVSTCNFLCICILFHKMCPRKFIKKSLELVVSLLWDHTLNTGISSISCYFQQPFSRENNMRWYCELLPRLVIHNFEVFTNNKFFTEKKMGNFPHFGTIFL